ncbi:MAG: hypothetical protein AAF813_03400 [Pseudomonadota bacterium]
MSRSKTITALIVAMGLAACTQGSDLERGAVGAAVGAVGANAIGESPVVGAAVGGAVGVLADN